MSQLVFPTTSFIEVQCRAVRKTTSFILFEHFYGAQNWSKLAKVDGLRSVLIGPLLQQKKIFWNCRFESIKNLPAVSISRMMDEYSEINVELFPRTTTSFHTKGK